MSIRKPDYPSGTRAYEGPDLTEMPKMILLALKLPKVDGLQVLRRIRTGTRTRRLPVVIFTSLSEQKT
jgi:two-component system response regulator